jgi:predicted DCC family thiol-disulfide oxidoreductase YuxK
MVLPDSTKQNSRIIIFDGLCNLCSGFMQFVYKRDEKDNFKFAWVQDEKSVKILDQFNLHKESLKTIILIESEIVYYKSSAFFKIVRLLRFPWPVLTVGYLIPRAIRDWIYDFIAENRYRWFGKKEQCMVPTGDLVKKFVK